MSGSCGSCGSPIPWLGRLRGDRLCASCAGTRIAEAQAALRTAASEEAVARWGFRVEVPPVSDREMRRFVQRVAQALPEAAKATEDSAQRAIVRTVWPTSIECAAHMSDSQTPECEVYTSAEDGIAMARRLLMELSPERPGIYLAYWRLWWTAARLAGSGVGADDLADENLSVDEAEASLSQLKALAYADRYAAADFGGPNARSGYVPFIDCPGCQLWRATEVFGLELG